ncbi:MAG TPA: hypothetical protein VE173_04420, partial [Longimicrobiales bacterium]|nr:hypothetical protein [Longimicrobiales bacterium]
MTLSLPFGRRAAGSLGACALATLLALPSAAAAQSSFQRTQRPNEPPYYAITGATLVTVSGRTIEGGTIVLEDGVITALGTDVQVPSYARVVDGNGFTVYPGLVDALSTLGHVEAQGGQTGGRGAAPAFGGRGGGAGAGADQEYSDEARDRPASTPWLTWADDLNPTDDRLAEWRRSGFTTALSMPDQGFFPGQAAVVDLAGGPEEAGKDMVVKTPVALRVNFSGGPDH